MAKLRFYHGLMGAGKSTLALQVADNFRRAGKSVLCFTGPTRAEGTIESRLGVNTDAIPFDHTTYFISEVMSETDRVVIDEAQFLAPDQVEELRALVDMTGLDVDCFGLKTDFTSRLFPGSQRLIEIADEVHEIQVPMSCWCGKPGAVNARVAHGRVQRRGPTVQIGDIDCGYEVLCFDHWSSGRVRGDHKC